MDIIFNKNNELILLLDAIGCYFPPSEGRGRAFESRRAGQNTQRLGQFLFQAVFVCARHFPGLGWVSRF